MKLDHLTGRVVLRIGERIRIVETDCGYVIDEIVAPRIGGYIRWPWLFGTLEGARSWVRHELQEHTGHPAELKN